MEMFLALQILTALCGFSAYVTRTAKESGKALSVTETLFGRSYLRLVAKTCMPTALL